MKIIQITVRQKSSNNPAYIIGLGDNGVTYWSYANTADRSHGWKVLIPALEENKEANELIKKL